MGGWGDGEMGRWGDGGIGRWGNREVGGWEPTPNPSEEGNIEKYLVMVEDGAFLNVI
ncbi:hypothetical protein [Okeania sp. KiyG1]|uniref:hypothetical protein n=1 Tax=Okeania sp. KiyG1 TaxID=2720165 RepID=UPI001922813B|nr:hypothetical protein [Okeania sp. KiyG1]